MTFFADHGADGQVQKWRLYYLGLTLPTSIPAAITAGSHTVTPGTMYGVSVGTVLGITDIFETRVVTAPSPATSGTSLVITTGDGAKLPGTPFYMLVWDTAATPVAPFVEILTVTAVSGDTLTITRAVTNQRTIIVGDSLAMCLVGGGPTTESVTVSGTATTTFTATFANPHAAGFVVSIPIPQYWTDCDLDIVTTGGVSGAHLWTAKPILAGPVSQQPDGASASFGLGDADGDYFAVFAANNGGELADAAIYEAGFLITNQTPTPDEVLQLFSGKIDRATANSATQDTIDIVLMPTVQQNAAMLPVRLVSSLVRVT